MAQGFLYLVAIIDWATRAVLAWRLSNTMDTGFCIAALDEAVARHGTPARHIAAPSDRLPKWVKGGCGRPAILKVGIWAGFIGFFGYSSTRAGW
jgi:transposase InsO family protein